MESIGEKLRLARERGSWTLDQVSRDTHVAKRFLKALEDEDFTVFPGETYAMGFLRTYAEYLALDPDELVAIYRNLQIQEQPLPMTELLDTRRRVRPRTVVLAAGATVIVLAVGALLLWRLLGDRGAAPRMASRGAPSEFVFEDEVRTRWVERGDVLVVPLGGERYRVEVAALGDTLTLKVPGGTAELAIGRERLLDLDGDARPDLKLVVNDIDRSSAERRANLGLYRVTAAAGAAAQQPPAEGAATDMAAAPAADAAAAAAASGGAPGVGFAAPPMRAATFRTVAMASGSAAEPFKVDFQIRGNCLFRFLVDAKEREERFFQKDETFSLDAKERITLWLSNAGAVRATIGVKAVDLGRSGEVGTRTISWRSDPSSGGYLLEIAPRY